MFQGHLLLQGFCDGMESLGYPTALPSYGTPLSCTAKHGCIALLQAVWRIVMYKIILFPLFCTVVSETWSVTLMEVRRLTVFENEKLTRVFGHIRKTATGTWRKLDSEVIHDTYSSPNAIRVIKSWKMRWAGDVACMGEERIVYRILIRSLKEIGCWEDLGVDGRIMLKYILKE